MFCPHSHRLIIPSLELRNGENLTLLELDGETELDCAFNRNPFVSRLSAACPRMTIYESLEVAQEKGLEVYHFGTAMAQL